MATSYDKQVRFFFRKATGIGINSIFNYGEQMLDRAVAAYSVIELQSDCLIDDAKNILQN